MKTARLLYDRTGLKLRLPDHARILRPRPVPALDDPTAAIRHAMAQPVASPTLGQIVRKRRPTAVAVTISDITRPVPNSLILKEIFRELGLAGVPLERVLVVVGTGMHRPSTRAERTMLLGDDFPRQVEVIDHRADAPETLVQVCDAPQVHINRRFVEADLRIVTGLIEPHFMAGFSGGRKGVCPALADLRTIQNFHSYDTLANPMADTGVLEGNPCHAISLDVARRVGVDFLLNVAINGKRDLCGVWAGELEQAHLRGCDEVARLTGVAVDRAYELVLSNGGGFPLDQTFYQAVKGMVGALPVLAPTSRLLVAAGCGEGVGSEAYSALMLRWGNRWQEFLSHLERTRGTTVLDQWEMQMQCRVLRRIGQQNLLFATDGIPLETQRKLGINPVGGQGDVRARVQRHVDRFVEQNPKASVAVIPDGPYTMLKP